MLHREDPEGLVVISQPAHARISGQLADAWGGSIAGELTPRNDVVLAAGQHDIGWLRWEMTPTLNPETGLPHSFREMPTPVHLDIWSSAGSLALNYGPYVALLVSKHGSGLYRRFHDFDRDTEEEAADARAFLHEAEAFEASLIEDLERQRDYRDDAADEIVERNRRLIGLWDGMSLAFCHGLRERQTFSGVPGAGGEFELELEPLDERGSRIAVRPWPFDRERVHLLTHGRRLTGTFNDDEAMLDALSAAPWVRIAIELVSMDQQEGK